jgi:hypothetical protein
LLNRILLEPILKDANFVRNRGLLFVPHFS